MKQRWHRWWLPAVLVLAGTLPALALGADKNESDADRHLREMGWAMDQIDLQGTSTPGVRHLYATGRVRLAAPLVWWAVAREDDPEWPGVNETVIEQVHGDTTIARYTLDVPIYKDRRYRLRTVNDNARMLEGFEMIPGYGNVRAIKGNWRVTALSDSLSRVDYIMDTDPGVRWVPGFIVNWATKRAIPDLWAHIYEAGSHYQRTEAKLVRPIR